MVVSFTVILHEGAQGLQIAGTRAEQGAAAFEVRGEGAEGTRAVGAVDEERLLGYPLGAAHKWELSSLVQGSGFKGSPGLGR
jgi:hypothetical protein